MLLALASTASGLSTGAVCQRLIGSEPPGRFGGRCRVQDRWRVPSRHVHAPL